MQLLPFMLVSLVVILTPGVDMALVTKNALLCGRPAALATAFGVIAGVAVRALAPRALPRAAAFRQGMMGNLSNPKMAVFFTSLLPQFAGPNPTARGAARLRALLDRVRGLVLIGLGVRLALERRARAAGAARSSRRSRRSIRR